MTTNNAANIAATIGTQIINQVAHGFAVGNFLYLNGSTYTKAIATSAAASQVIGVVIKSIDADNFILQSNGIVAGLSGLTAGTLYYLSGSSAGAITATITSTDSSFAKAVLIAQSTTSGLLINDIATQYFANDISSSNLLHNGSFMINSWGQGAFTSGTTPVNSNNTYLVDRWVYLASAANTVNVTVNTSSPQAFAQSNQIVFNQQTANQQYGFVQLIETPSAATYTRTPYTFIITASKAAGNATASKIRFAILQWNGTVNAMTSNLVSAWAGGGTDPTLAANWSYLVSSTAITLNANNSYYSIQGTTGTSLKNIAVFIWLDDTNATAGDIINLNACWLLPGTGITVPANATTAASGGALFPLKSISVEQLDCQRYFRTSYNNTVNPGTVSTVGQSAAQAVGTSTSITGMQKNVSAMRATPTVTWYSPSSGTAANLRNVTAAADAAVTSTTGPGTTSTGYPVLTGAPTDKDILTGHFTLNANL